MRARARTHTHTHTHTRTPQNNKTNKNPTTSSLIERKKMQSLKTLPFWVVGVKHIKSEHGTRRWLYLKDLKNTVGCDAIRTGQGLNWSVTSVCNLRLRPVNHLSSQVCCEKGQCCLLNVSVRDIWPLRLFKLAKHWTMWSPKCLNRKHSGCLFLNWHKTGPHGHQNVSKHTTPSCCSSSKWREIGPRDHPNVSKHTTPSCCSSSKWREIGPCDHPNVSKHTTPSCCSSSQWCEIGPRDHPNVSKHTTPSRCSSSQ